MPKTEEQNRAIREEKIMIIKESALDLFAEKSYQSTTVQQIAKKAGVSKGLLYNYFESKEELLTSIIDDFLAQATSFFDPNRDGILTDEEFYFYISKSFEIVKDKPRHWKLYTMLGLQPGVIKIIENEAMKFSSSIAKTLYEYFLKKNCKDPESEMFFFSSLLKGAIIQYVTMPEMVPLDKIKNHIIDFYKQKFK